MRSVAEREAGRLARPDRPQQQSLAHASRLRSAVSSTPSGFGTFKRTKENPQVGISPLSSSQEWCGPFSVARQMIAAREEVKKRREQEYQEGVQKSIEKHPLDAIIQEVETEQKRKTNPSLTWRAKVVDDDKDWTGKKQNLYHKRQKRYKKQNSLQDQDSVRIEKVPSLFDLCIKFIVDNFESVEALGLMMDSNIRKKICEQLVATGRFNGAAFDTLAEVGVETLEIIDCTEVTQEQLKEALDQLMSSGLRALILSHCGRCFGSSVVDSIVNSPINDLFVFSISGAYLLQDAEAAKIVMRSAKTLSSIEFKACQMIGSEFCSSLATHYASKANIGNSLLELSLQDVPLSKDNLNTLAKTDALRNLKSMSFCQMESLDDEVLFAILVATKGNLEGIDLTNCINLTDETLSSIRKCNSKGRLKSLKLGGIKNFTAAGLEAFFTFGIPGLPNPPALRTLDLSSGDFESVNEAVISLAITASALKQTAEGAYSHASSKARNSELSALGGLAFLDVSGSSAKDKNIEELCELCSTTLIELKISFCPELSDSGLGYLVSKCGNQLTSIEIWGNAQIGDNFLDGHDRIGKGLIVEGAWMKQNTGKGHQR
jgi:DNA repair protein RAD7